MSGGSARVAGFVKSVDAGSSAGTLVDILSNYVLSSHGSLRTCIWRSLGPLAKRDAGNSPKDIFPLPLMRRRSLPRRGRGRARARARNSFLEFVNITIACLNFMHSGRVVYSCVEPSGAQRRLMDNIFYTVSSFLRGGVSASGERAIRKYLLEDLHSYRVAGSHALPLGLRAGVPERAAQVDLAQALHSFSPDLARQVEHPRELLLPKPERPATIPRPFCRLHATYPEYVRRNIKAGLQKLKPRRTIFKFKGRPLYSGAFAVAKNEDEDRAISALCPLNALVDVSKLWKPRFAIMSMLRTLRLQPGRLLRIYKKDARHFFHFLRVGHRWEKYFSHPALIPTHQYDEMYPVHRGVPMGFTAAASWAQAYNEAKAQQVGLPVERRLVDSQPPPSAFPIWGSILDDIWALDECETEADPHRDAHEWLRKMAMAWERDGVQEHMKKAVQGKLREEVQGAMVDGVEGWVGMSKQKRLQLLESGLYILSQPRPLVGIVDRWVGKLSYARSFRVCARSVLQDIYSWLSKHRNVSRRAWLWPSVKSEILMSIVLLPFLQADLRGPWCSRVEASDAAPGGHGRAWTQMDGDRVAEAARLCSHKGVYTTLTSPSGVTLDSAGRCPMQQAKLPIYAYTWHTAARPGGYKHITLEEAIALNWSLHERLRRPGEVSSRVLHLVDSAAAAGAFKKGRSTSRRLNGCCRQACALILAGGLEPFICWVPTDQNPADEPSSRHGVRAGSSYTLPPRPSHLVEIPPCGRLPM